MKLPLIFGVVLCALYGCQPPFDRSNQQEAQMPVTSTSAHRIDWRQYGELPAAKGISSSIGISAAFTGVLDHYLIVAGGANFPAGHPFFDQAIKAYYADLWLFDTTLPELRPAYHLELPYPVAHGALVQTEQSVLLIGGQNAEGALSAILEVSVVAGKPSIKHWGELPFSWHSGAAAWYLGELYLFGGERNGLASAGVCRFNLQTKACQELAPIPGPARVQFPAQQVADTLYIFGGIDAKSTSNNFSRTDAYAFNLQTLQWSRLAEVSYQQQPFSVSGGAAVALNEDEILLLGGVDLALFNNTLTQFAKLQGDELQQFKTRYFHLTSEEINFSRRQLVFNTRANLWYALAEQVPFTGGAGPLTLAKTAQHIYWVGGETKPGVRSPLVYRGLISPP